MYFPNIPAKRGSNNKIPITPKKIIDKPTIEDTAARKCGIGKNNGNVKFFRLVMVSSGM
jgi:hypothetical protein